MVGLVISGSLYLNMKTVHDLHVMAHGLRCVMGVTGFLKLKGDRNRPSNGTHA